MASNDRVNALIPDNLAPVGRKKKAFDYYGNLNAMIEDWLERGPGFFRVIKKRVNDLF